MPWVDTGMVITLAAAGVEPLAGPVQVDIYPQFISMPGSPAWTYGPNPDWQSSLDSQPDPRPGMPKIPPPYSGGWSQYIIPPPPYTYDIATGDVFGLSPLPPAPPVVVGDFGESRTPGDLPPDGVIPLNWDAVGDAPHQMLINEALRYLPADTSDGYYNQIYVFVGVGDPTGVGGGDPTGWYQGVDGEAVPADIIQPPHGPGVLNKDYRYLHGPLQGPGGLPDTTLEGGWLIAQLACYDGDITTTEPPAGWTVLTSMSSPAYSGMAGGVRIPKSGGLLGQLTAEFEIGYVEFIDTGFHLLNVPIIARSIAYYDLPQVSQVVVGRPMTAEDWQGPVTIEWPWVAPRSVWLLSMMVAAYGGPYGDAAVPDPITYIDSATWVIRRANFDGSAAEVVGEYTFHGRAPGTYTEGVSGIPNHLQVRAANDNEAVASTYFGSRVLRARPTDGAIDVTPAALQAPWDVLALDENTFIAVGATSDIGLSSDLLVWRSMDAGANWDLVSTIPLDQSFMLRGAVDSYPMISRVRGDLLNIVMLGNADSNIQQQVWRSNDAGTTWSMEVNTADPIDSLGEFMVYGPGGILQVRLPQPNGAAHAPFAAVLSS